MLFFVLMLIWWIACWMRSQSSWGGFFVVIMMLFCVCTGRLCLFSICVLICGSTLCVVWGELFQSSFPKAWEHVYFLASTVSSTFFCWMCSGNNLHVLCILWSLVYLGVVSHLWVHLVLWVTCEYIFCHHSHLWVHLVSWATCEYILCRESLVSISCVVSHLWVHLVSWVHLVLWVTCEYILCCESLVSTSCVVSHLWVHLVCRCCSSVCLMTSPRLITTSQSS